MTKQNQCEICKKKLNKKDKSERALLDRDVLLCWDCYLEEYYNNGN